MSVSAEEQRERLSLAFLSHKVTELERSVDSIHFSRDPRLYDPHGPAIVTRNAHGGNSSKREKRVVDCSAFLYALPVLKRWIREDSYQIIVPLQVISTLDILKKAPTQLHGLAREATRFLASQLAIAREIEGEARAVGMKERKEWDSRLRLRAQEAQEELGWNTAAERFVVGEEEWAAAAALVPERKEDGEEVEVVLPTADDVPRGIRSTLQCALYFQDQDPTSTTTLYSNPSLTPTPAPLHFVADSTPQSRNAQPAPIDFLALASGNQLAHWSTYFSHPTTSIGSSEIVAAREWAKVQAAALKESQAQGGTSPKKYSARAPGSNGRGGANAGRGGGGSARGGREDDGSNRRGGMNSRGRGRADDRVVMASTGRTGGSGDGPVSGRGRGGTLFIP